MITHILFYLLYFTSPAEAFSLDASTQWDLSTSGQSEKKFLVNGVSKSSCPEDKFLEFPNVMHAAQHLYIDGQLSYSTAVAESRRLRSIYNSIVVPCEEITNHKLEWKVVSNVKYFEKTIIGKPVVTSRQIINRTEILHLTVFGALFIVGIFILVSTLKTEFFISGMSIATFSMAMGLFFLFSVSGIVGISSEYLLIDKIAGISLALGILSFVRFLVSLKVIRPIYNKATMSFAGLCILLIAGSSNGDQVQMVLNIMFIPGLLATWMGIVSVRKVFSSFFEIVLSYLGMGSFAISALMDVLYTYGLHNLGMLLGAGTLGSVLFFGLLIQGEILLVNSERDRLRNNLETEVQRKTEYLTNALSKLKLAQAELVQSAKLASLGTLSAGLAHEINNSINYVNGAMLPLQRIVERGIVNQGDLNKAKNLFSVIEDGLKLTIEIIKSLRNYSGLNQAKMKELEIKDIVASVTTILKNKLRNNIELRIDLPDGIKLHGSVVGLNQIFMNIITNALDAMPKGGVLEISARLNQENVDIVIKDSGAGIDSHNLSKIFDPFFTTKEVGSGTGLGLYIVKKEVDRHNGRISVDSELGKGTIFKISLPKSGAIGDGEFEGNGVAA